MPELFLTFDIEDFINEISMRILFRIVKDLERHRLRALFFITGQMAEKLIGFPTIVNLLHEQEIGYHSSGHSVHPAVFKFTDVNSYEKAYKVSIQRETSHVDPFTGKMKGRGGIYALEDLFPQKRISSFRAPGLCWIPPHLEALRSLGIKYDFSAKFSKAVEYKDIVFYPYPTRLAKSSILASILKRQTIVIMMHPHLWGTQRSWDSIYFESNPVNLVTQLTRKSEDIQESLFYYDLFLKRIKDMDRSNLLEITADLKSGYKTLVPNNTDFKRCYQRAMDWPVKYFKYQPCFLRKHFLKFFELDMNLK